MGQEDIKLMKSHSIKGLWYVWRKGTTAVLRAIKWLNAMEE